MPTRHEQGPRAGDSSDAVAITVRTLLTNGFRLVKANRVAAAMLLHCRRTDEFGITVPYVVALADGVLTEASAGAISRLATRARAHLVIIGETEIDGIPHVPWDTFLARFGGPVRTWLPLNPEFATQLVALGHNRRVAGLAGRPDDLFEEYVHAGLQFLVAGRVIRYGQERLFERLPDGVGFAEPRATIFLYDAKAAEHGYKVTSETMRQFADYVRDFRARYKHYLGEPHAFVLVSGTFADGADARKARSEDLYSDCRVPLVFMDAQTLGAATTLFAESPAFRTVVDWGRLLSRTEVTIADIRKELEARRKDGVVALTGE
jgi:hypothetical protein